MRKLGRFLALVIVLAGGPSAAVPGASKPCVRITPSSSEYQGIRAALRLWVKAARLADPEILRKATTHEFFEELGPDRSPEASDGDNPYATARLVSFEALRIPNGAYFARMVVRAVDDDEPIAPTDDTVWYHLKVVKGSWRVNGIAHDFYPNCGILPKRAR